MVRQANRLENNFHISNKKCLFYNIRSFFTYIEKDPFEHIPVTFHIKKGLSDPEFQKFLNYYNKRKKQIASSENPKKQRNI